MSDIIQNDTQLDMATNALATMEKKEVEPRKTPMDQLEEDVMTFVKDAFAVTMGSTFVKRALEEKLVERVKTDQMKNDELITLYNIEHTSDNDRIFKLLSPSIGVITNRQNAEIQAAAKKEQLQSQANGTNVNIAIGSNGRDALLASETPPEVTSGLNTLHNLLQAMASLSQKKQAEKENAVEVEAQ